jgi:peptidoglycan/xylan/chitin deacetylase (PgdA/CDA1 family)
VPPAIPNYYTCLGPFSELFTQGVPCLTYHKLGPRPARVRLKGLYVGKRLFERQLSELREAGFRPATFGPPSNNPGNSDRRVALTFDDGFVNVFKHALEPLAAHGFHAIEFLVADLLGRSNEWEVAQGEAREPLMDAAQVREWLAAGHEIGSHALTHPFLAQISPKQAREEIFASKKKLEDSFGVPIRHFCYPYGEWNPAIRDLVIEAGYETACTTDFGVNDTHTHPHELKRITARYQSISLKAIKERLARFKSGR